ncbi:MAG: hypothetical protein J6S09_05020, partial [Paludibacteraceae bacterium]|nr:hypothetical protein [Paludibacteraceae bacterium]
KINLTFFHGSYYRVFYDDFILFSHSIRLLCCNQYKGSFFSMKCKKTHKKTANEQPHSPKNLKLKEVFIPATS